MCLEIVTYQHPISFSAHDSFDKNLFQIIFNFIFWINQFNISNKEEIMVQVIV